MKKIKYDEETNKVIKDLYKRSLFRLYLPLIFISIVFIITLLYGGEVDAINESVKDNQTGDANVDSILNILYAFFLVTIDFVVNGAKIFNLFIISVLLIKDLFKFILLPNPFNKSVRNRMHSSISFILSCGIIYLLGYHNYFISFIKEFI